MAAITRMFLASRGYSPLSATPLSPLDVPAPPRRGTYMSSFLFALVPSPIQHRFRPESRKPQRLTPTSWLDGLRGYAALFVALFHLTVILFEGYTIPYGTNYGGDTTPSSPVQLPFIRVIISGKPMVHIFFVISGFVLSYKPLKHIRNGAYSDLHQALSSSAFRRWLRLYLPCIASTLMILPLIRMGLLRENERMETLSGQFRHWLSSLYFITNPWKWEGFEYMPYDHHLWTIPIEFSQSLILFLVILALSNLRTPVRLGFLAAIILYCLRGGHWATVEYLAGMGIAEIGMIQESPSKTILDMDSELEATSFRTRTRSSAWTFIYGIFLTLNLLFALYVIGWPFNDFADQVPLFQFLINHTPEPYASSEGDNQVYVWYALASIQVVFVVHQSPVLQQIFTTRFAQYLARVSYALYLVHGTVLFAYMPRIMPLIWGLVGPDPGFWGKHFAYGLANVAFFVPVFWAADLFWRVVDINSIAFSRWMERWCNKRVDVDGF